MSIKILSKDNSITGTDLYRDDNTAVPAAYRATIEHKVDMNKAGSNANVNIRTQVPVTYSADGRVSSVDAFKMRTYFTGLQNISGAVERDRAFEEHVKMLILARVEIKEGILPDEPYDTTQTLKSVLTAYAGTFA